MSADLHAFLSADHERLDALLATCVRAGDTAAYDAFRRGLLRHNPLEEDAGGLYEIMETLAGDELAALMTRVHAIPAVRVVPNADSAIVRSSIEQLVREAEEGRRRFRIRLES